MKLHEEFKLYEDLWDDISEKDSSNKYIVSYKNVDFNITDENELYKYIVARAKLLAQNFSHENMTKYRNLKKGPYPQYFVEANKKYSNSYARAEAMFRLHFELKGRNSGPLKAPQELLDKTDQLRHRLAEQQRKAYNEFLSAVHKLKQENSSSDSADEIVANSDRSYTELTEAKADTERLVAFAGEDLANRFLAVKNRLKTPENDLYYWIKNKTPEELATFLNTIEQSKSVTQTKKDIADQGAELVCSSEHWKVYHITTFEASQKYGRDSKWCITGVGGYGDKYWKDYISNGIKFYFLITKGKYNPRGRDSKFAIAVYPNKNCEVFDQGDGKVALNQIPYFDEIDYPLFKELEEAGASYQIHIDNSDKSLQGTGADEEALEEILTFIRTLTQEEKDNLALFWRDEEDEVVVSVYAPSESSGLVQGADNRMIANWDYAADQIKRALNMPDYSEVNDDCSSYHVFVEGTDKEANGKGVSLYRAMVAIEQFISHLSRAEKRNVGLWWNWDDSEPGDFDGDIVVQVETPSAQAEGNNRFLYNWDRGYYSVKRVLGE